MVEIKLVDLTSPSRTLNAANVMSSLQFTVWECPSHQFCRGSYHQPLGRRSCAQCVGRGEGWGRDPDSKLSIRMDQ